jgi:hypothetical protein
MKTKFRDGEVVSKDTDGCLILWDGDNHKTYNCGETLKEFGEKNLTAIELKRVNK